jgi:hypothetical protein
MRHAIDQVSLPKTVKPTINILRSCMHVCPSSLYPNEVVQHSPIIECSKRTQVNFPSTVSPPQLGMFKPFLRFRAGSIRPHLSSHCCVGVLYDTFQGSSNASNLVIGLAKVIAFEKFEKLTKSTPSRYLVHCKPSFPERYSYRLHQQRCRPVQMYKRRSHHHNLFHHR